MLFRLFEPIAPLKRYIAKIWAFESDGPLPNDDMKLIVPDGKLLLVFPFRNGMVGKMGEHDYLTRNNRLALVGVSECPSIVDAETPGPTGTIGVEINPIGAYRFFHLKLRTISGRLNNLVDVLGTPAEIIERKMIDELRIEGKIQVLQAFLYTLLTQEDEDYLYEYCIRKIGASRGGIKVRELEKDTGYTLRWLNMKFEERLGISPKNLCSIVRFQHTYQALAATSTGFPDHKLFYDHYYDESHFIKAFKKFTGLPPSRFMRSKNDFGRMFYRD